MGKIGLAPGRCALTDLTLDIEPETNFFHGKLSDQRRAALIGATHNGRAGHPSDIAETIYFLASDGARHITGQTLHVNGGAHTTR